jgi:hypothetical protein
MHDCLSAEGNYGDIPPEPTNPRMQVTFLPLHDVENVILNARPCEKKFSSKFDGLHRDDDAELSFTTGHPGIGLIDLTERKFLYHGADAG